MSDVCLIASVVTALVLLGVAGDVWWRTDPAMSVFDRLGVPRAWSARIAIGCAALGIGAIIGMWVRPLGVVTNGVAVVCFAIGLVAGETTQIRSRWVRAGAVGVALVGSMACAATA